MRLCQPENRWAAACLLGVTCREVGAPRFLAAHTAWFAKLFFLLKPSEPIFVRAAATAALSDLLTRLGSLVDMGSVRRDGAVLCVKLAAGPLLPLLRDTATSSLWGEVVDLLCTLLRTFPATVRPHVDLVESLLVAKLLDAVQPRGLLRKCAVCLALLPRAAGDAGSWSSLVRRVLLAVHNILDGAFAGLEDVATARQATEDLLPARQEPPWPLGGGSNWQQQKYDDGSSLGGAVVARVITLLRVLRHLLTQPFPQPVPAPTDAIMALVVRILHVDGTLGGTGGATAAGFTTSAHHEALSAELPILHMAALNVLLSTLQGCRSQLLARSADIARLLSECFRLSTSPLCPPPVLARIYTVASHFITAMGSGMASALAPSIVGQALADLRPLAPALFSPRTPGGRTLRRGLPGFLGGWTTAGGVPLSTGSLEPLGTFGSADFPESVAGQAHVQTAALEALRSLLCAGGSLLPDKWRSEVDAVVATVAMAIVTPPDDAPPLGLTVAGSGALLLLLGQDNVRIPLAALQVAACRALLASLLAPCCHRPPYLGQALVIFRRGRQVAGTELAQVCAQALMALEPLLHPRCLPPMINPAILAATSLAARAGSAGPNLGSAATSAQGLAHHSRGAVPGDPMEGLLDPWAEVDAWFGPGYGEDLDDVTGLFDLVGAAVQAVALPGAPQLQDQLDRADPKASPATGAQQLTMLEGVGMASHAGAMPGLEGTSSKALVSSVNHEIVQATAAWPPTSDGATHQIAGFSEGLQAAPASGLSGAAVRMPSDPSWGAAGPTHEGSNVRFSRPAATSSAEDVARAAGEMASGAHEGDSLVQAASSMQLDTEDDPPAEDNTAKGTGSLFSGRHGDLLSMDSDSDGPMPNIVVGDPDDDDFD
eukprot:SM000191S05212  [mRNA]  locus=s191:55323:60007:- [translate_table: standard]